MSTTNRWWREPFNYDPNIKTPNLREIVDASPRKRIVSLWCPFCEYTDWAFDSNEKIHQFNDKHGTGKCVPVGYAITI